MSVCVCVWGGGDRIGRIIAPPTHPEISVGYRTGNHYRLSEYTGRLIIDYTIENIFTLQKTVISIK